MNTKGIIAIVVGVVLLVLLRWAVGRMEENQRVEAEAKQAVLAQDTVEAARDTSRALSIEGVLGDSLRATQRRAIQVEQRADKLDAALRMERVARDQLEASVVALRATVRTDTVSIERDPGTPGTRGDGVRRAVFDLRQEPYTVHSEVAIPAPPASGRMEVEVALDTLTLEVRVDCGIAPVDGVRPASLTVISPTWASIRLGRVEQTPTVCSPITARTSGAGWAVLRGFIERFGVSVGYAATRTPSGTIVAGPSLALGVRVWP